MNKKIRNILWVTVLFAFSFPIGYAFMVVYDKMIVYREKTMNIIISGIGIIIVVGLISFITYKILKKRSIGKDPAKTALIIYSVILIIYALISIPFYEDAVLRHETQQVLDLMPIPG